MTKGIPLRRSEVYLQRRLGTWLWKDTWGRVWTRESIEDDHLVNVERYLLGRGDLAKSPTFGPGNKRWDRSYNIVRDEIEFRGLELHADDQQGALDRHPEEKRRAP